MSRQLLLMERELIGNPLPSRRDYTASGSFPLQPSSLCIIPLHKTLSICGPSQRLRGIVPEELLVASVEGVLVVFVKSHSGRC